MRYPGKNFVPVYYMGSEDNDLDELGTFNYAGKRYRWDGGGQSGAIGRMKTQSLKPLLNDLFKVLGPPGKHLDALTKLLTEAYIKHETVGMATRYLVNELFGRFGLIVIDPDDAALKKQFEEIMKDDLLNQQAYSLVSEQGEKLEESYKTQAYPRPINLFYLKENLRERIERHDNNWHILHTDIKWTKTELLGELEKHPERFSPNVILRGLYQETILPNVAFIGGGAEVAYWLQLRSLFDYYHVFYPAILLRQSVLWIDKRQSELRKKASLSIDEIFKPETDLVRNYINAHSGNNWQTVDEIAGIEKIMEQLRAKATALDPTLGGSADAVITKIRYQVQVLEKKMLRAEKRRMQTELLRISKLKQDIFPNHSLQERVENFAGYYLQYGPAFFDVLKDAIQPLKQEFLVIEEK
jgi:bacillithiol biosynthesis cysteine-adding enzyme BshC